MTTTSWRERLDATVHSVPVTRFVMAVIIVNAITLGLETSESAMNSAGGLIRALDVIALTIFVIEIAAKLVARGPKFFADGWNVFDFLIVGVALVPGSNGLSALRALRVLRVLRLIRVMPRLRFVVEALIRALPGIGSIALLMVLVFYISAVMATHLFSETFPEWFGSVGESLYTLFQVMTLESWSMGIVRPVMEVHPWAWAFFVPFILVSAFTMLNLFIAVIVDTMTAMHNDSEPDPASNLGREEYPSEAPGPGHEHPCAHSSNDQVRAEVAALREQVGELTALLRAREDRSEQG